MATKSNVRLGGAYVEITANNGKLIDALKDSESRIQTFVNEFAKTGASLSALGLGVAAPMKKAVDTFAEFERQMLITQAVTKATDAQLARLTKQAKDLGATTSWTAAQVAEGMVALGRMGFSNREIQGTISSVMDLGRALDTDVNQAAKELGAVMRQFQADSSQAGHYADALATATNGAAIEMDELLESMKYVGTAGNALGADVETVLALTMALRNAGVSASQAGTQLRSMFISLQAPKNLQLFADKFGVEIYDANGRLKSFIDILIEAQKRAGALGDQLLVVARQMFGKLQAPGFLALLQSPDLERFRDMLYECDGAAEAFREGMESGVYGSLKRSLSMVERVSIDLGESLAPTVREVEDAVKDITTFIGRFIEENKPLINLIAKTALEFGSLGATMLAGAGIMKGFAGTSRLVFTGATNIALAWRKAGESAETLNAETTALETTLAKMAGTAPGEALAASLNTAAVAAKEATAAVEGLASANAKLGATSSAGAKPFIRKTDVNGMSFVNPTLYAGNTSGGSYNVNDAAKGFATINGQSAAAYADSLARQERDRLNNLAQGVRDNANANTAKAVEEQQKALVAQTSRQIDRAYNYQVSHVGTPLGDAAANVRESERQALKAARLKNRAVDYRNLTVSTETERIGTLNEQFKRIDAENKALVKTVETNAANRIAATVAERDAALQRAKASGASDKAIAKIERDANRRLEAITTQRDQRLARLAQSREKMIAPIESAIKSSEGKISRSISVVGLAQETEKRVNERLQASLRTQDKAEKDFQKEANKTRTDAQKAAKGLSANIKAVNAESQKTFEQMVAVNNERYNTQSKEIATANKSISIKGGGSPTGATFSLSGASTSVSGAPAQGKTTGVSGSVNVGQIFFARSTLSTSSAEQTDALAVAMRNRARYAKRYAQLEAAINQRIGGDQLAMSQKEAAVLNNLRRRVYYYDNVVSQISQMRLRFTQAAPDDVGQYDYATSASATGASQFKVNSQTTSLTKTITQGTEANNKYSVSTKAMAGNLSLVSGESAKAAPKVAAVGESAKRSALGMQALKFAGGATLGVLRMFASMAVSMIAWTTVLKVFEGIANYAHKAAEDMRKAQESNDKIFDKDKQMAEDTMAAAMSDEEKIEKLVSVAGSNKTLNNVEWRQLDALYDDLNNRGIVRGWVMKDPTTPTGYRVLNAGAIDAMKGNAALYKSQELAAAGEDLSVSLHSFDPNRFQKGVRANSGQVQEFIKDYADVAAVLENMTDEQKNIVFGNKGFWSSNQITAPIKASGVAPLEGLTQKQASDYASKEIDERFRQAGISGLKGSESFKRFMLALGGINMETGVAKKIDTAPLQAFVDSKGESFLTVFRQLKEFGASIKAAEELAAASEAYFADARENRDKPFNSDADAKQAEADAATAAADLATKFAEFDAALGKAEERAKSPAQRELDALEKQFKEIQEGMKDSTDQAKLEELAKLEERYTAQRVELQKQINEELEREAKQRAKENSERVVEGLNADVRDFIGAIFAGNGQKADELGAGIDAQLKNFAGTDVDLSKFYEESVSTIRDALERTKTTLSSTGTFNAYEAADFGRDYQLDVQKEQLAALRSANRGLQNIYAFMQSDEQYKEYI